MKLRTLTITAALLLPLIVPQRTTASLGGSSTYTPGGTGTTRLRRIVGQERKINPDLPNPRIKEEYNRFSDLTSIVLDLRLIDLPRPSRRILMLSFVGMFPGGKPSTELRTSILITSYSKEWCYLRPVLFQVLVNGTERGTLGEMQRTASKVLDEGVVEQIHLTVPLSALEKLSRASKLEIRIGSEEMEFSESHLGDLRQWLRMVRPVKAASDNDG